MSAAITSRRALLTAGAATIASGAAMPASAGSGGDAELTRLVAVYREADARLDAADEAQGDAVERLWDLGGLYLPTPEAMFAREGDKAFGIFHSLSIDHDDADQVRFHVSPDHVNYLRKVPRKREGLRWERVEDRDRDTFFLHRRTRDGVEEFGVTINVPWPEAQARADENIAAHDGMEAEIARRKHVSGKDAAYAIARSERHEALAAIAMTPARSVDGMMLKLSVLLGWYDGADDLVSDIAEATTSSEEMAYSIARDLAKLSGRA